MESNIATGAMGKIVFLMVLGRDYCWACWIACGFTGPFAFTGDSPPASTSFHTIGVIVDFAGVSAG